MRSSVHNGVRFVEGRPRNAQPFRRVEVKIGGVITSAQLKSLDDVKDLLAKRTTAAGGNAIIDFCYGQKLVGFLAVPT